MTVAGGKIFICIYWLVCLGAFLVFLVGVLQKVSSYRSSTIVETTEDFGEEAPLPDVVLCLPAWSAQVAFNSGGWQKQPATNGGDTTQWTTNGATLHGVRKDGWNGGKRCQGYAPEHGQNEEKYPCVKMGYSHATMDDFCGEACNLPPTWDGTKDSVYMINNQAKWDYPGSYSHETDNIVTQALLYTGDNVYDGSAAFDAATYKPVPLPIDETATAMAAKRTYAGDTTPIKGRCFIFKNPRDDEGKPTISQDRGDHQLWFEFKLSIGVTWNSAASYMMGHMWFVGHDTDLTGEEIPGPNLEVPFHNSMNSIELSMERITDQTKGDDSQKTVYHAQMQSNTQMLYHSAPTSQTFSGRLAFTQFKFRMTPTAPVKTTIKRNRGLGDYGADLGGLWTFMFIIIGVFFKGSGLIDKDGNQVTVFSGLELPCLKSTKLRLLRAVPLFRGAEEDGSKQTQIADESKEI